MQQYYVSFTSDSPNQVLRTDFSSFCKPFACCFHPVALYVMKMYALFYSVMFLVGFVLRHVQFSVQCFVDRCFVLFNVSVVFLVLRFTGPDYPLGIFKLFLQYFLYGNNHKIRLIAKIKNILVILISLHEENIYLCTSYLQTLQRQYFITGNVQCLLEK